MGSRRVRHDWATSLSLSTFMHWRRKWQPTPVFLPGESQGRRSLVSCRLWGCKESDITEPLSLTYVCAVDSQSSSLIPNISWTLYSIAYIGWVNLIDMIYRAPCDLAQGSLYFRRRQWQPTPELLPGKTLGWRSLVGYSPWGHEESDMTVWTHCHFSLSCTGEGNGNPLQCSCLENPRDGGAWWADVYGVTQSRTWLKRLSSSSSSILLTLVHHKGFRKIIF